MTRIRTFDPLHGHTHKSRLPANLRYTRSKVQRKLNFREQERETEREKGRKARSACNLRLVGRDAGERVALVSRSFLNSGREERGATRSRGRGRLLATTRPFARRLGPPLLASCRPTTASVCFRALVCASSGATVALLLYRPIRTFGWRPLSLSRSRADHLATVWDRKWGRAPLALCASSNFTTAGALIAGSCAIPEGCGCNFSPPWKR